MSSNEQKAPRYYVSDSEHAELWPWGPYGSREEAIAGGRTEFGGDEFWIGQERMRHAGEFVPCASVLLEQMREQAVDECGEVAEDWPD